MNTRFEMLLNRQPHFVLPAKDKEPRACQFAEPFSKWVDELCAKVEREPNVILTNQMKILLVDKFFEWRSVAPKRHLNHLGSKGHKCLFQILCEAYQRIKTVELSLCPPMLFLPTPTAPPANLVQSIQGIFIGEDIEEESSS